MRTTICVLAVAGALSLAVAACGEEEDGSDAGKAQTSATAGGGGDVKGALVQVIDAAPSPAVQGLDKGYKQRAAELGIKVDVAQSNFDPTKDIANIKDAISKGAKGLLLIPVSVAADTPALNEAAAKGLCVGVAYSNVSEDKPIAPGIKTYLGYDDNLGGRNLAEAIAKKMGGKGGLVFIGGAAADPGTQTREKAVRALLKEKYPDIKFLGSQPADYDAAKARTVMQNFVQQYGDQITGVIAAADNMAEAAADYVATSKLKGKVAIGGFGGQKTFFDRITAGKAYASVPFPVVDDGKRAMDRIAECIKGDKSTKFDSSTTQPALQPLKDANYVVTADNADGYTPQY